MNSEVVVLRLSCSAACGIFPDQGLNLCHQGSLLVQFLKNQGTKVYRASLIAQLVKNPQETLVRFVGLEDPLEKG